MPCTDGRDITGPQIIHEELNRLTRILCGVLTALEELGEAGMNDTIRVGGCLDETKLWWEKHKRRDAKRNTEWDDEDDRLHRRMPDAQKVIALTRALQDAVGINDDSQLEEAREIIIKRMSEQKTPTLIRCLNGIDALMAVRND